MADIFIISHTMESVGKLGSMLVAIFSKPKKQKNERWKSFKYDELIARDKTNLDIFWLKDESLVDTENLPAPELLAQEIVEQLESALEEFRSVEEVLAGNNA